MKNKASSIRRLEEIHSCGGHTRSGTQWCWEGQGVNTQLSSFSLSLAFSLSHSVITRSLSFLSVHQYTLLSQFTALYGHDQCRVSDAQSVHASNKMQLFLPLRQSLSLFFFYFCFLCHALFLNFFLNNIEADTAF